MRARLICQGQRSSEVMTSSPTGRAVLNGITTGEKYKKQAARYIKLLEIADILLNLSLMFKSFIKSIFDGLS
jgi:hypothetical protein